MNNKEYYVYVYKNPLKNNQIFYIGLGKWNRKGGSKSIERLYEHYDEYKRGIISKNLHKHRTIDNIVKSGKEPIIEIFKNHLTHDEGSELEKQLIQEHKSEIVNIAKGGDGGDTFTNQPEYKKQSIINKIRESSTGRYHKYDTIKKMREIKLGSKNPFYGKTHTPENRVKMSLATKGKLQSKEQIKNRVRISIYYIENTNTGDVYKIYGAKNVKLLFISQFRGTNYQKLTKHGESKNWKVIKKELISQSEWDAINNINYVKLR